MSIALGAYFAAANANAAAGPGAAATAPTTPAPWCVTLRDGSRACYASLFSCILAGIANAGPCAQQPVVEAPAANEVRQHSPAPPHRAPAPTRKHSLTAAQQEQLFRDFVKWTDRSSGNPH